AVLQRGGAGKARAVERKITVASHAVEKRRVVKLGTVERGDAVEFDAGKCRAAKEPRAVETHIAEEARAADIDRRVEGAVGEPGEPLEDRAAQRERGIERRPGEIEMRQRRAVTLDRRVDDEAAQILDLAAPQRCAELGESRVHAVAPAAPAGG